MPPELDLAMITQPWVLSAVVPACNSGATLETTVRRLLELPGGPPHEIVVVENGSSDDTWERLEQLQKNWHEPTRLVALRSDRGIGAAYRVGVAATSGDRVLLTADDLPFGTTDVEAVLACRCLPRFAIGSKAHPRSRVPRTLARKLATGVFRIARRAVLGLHVGDTQGTFVIEGDLARRLVASTRVTGFGMTTELVALAAQGGEQPVELPVVLGEHPSPSRIRWLVDGSEMLVDLVELRRRVGSARHPKMVTVSPPHRTSRPRIQSDDSASDG